MKKRLTRTLSLFLILILFLTILPIAAAAPKDVDLPVGQYYDGLADGNYYEGTDGYFLQFTTLPSGLAWTSKSNGTTMFWYFVGTVDSMGGVTVWTPWAEISDFTTTLNIFHGPQTIIQPDMTWSVNSGNFQLTPYSINGNGDRISGITYQFKDTGNNPGVATVDSYGYVTVNGPGTTQFQITSTGSSYYAWASPLTFTLTVVEDFVPLTGDGNHLAIWAIVLTLSLAGVAGRFIYRKRQQKTGGNKTP